jgi:uncharacterized membrane protein (DUF106 family)
LINGGWLSQLWDETLQHWQHALAAGAAIRQALPLQEWIKIAVVAIVTAVITSQVTLVRLDERIKALEDRMRAVQNERDFIIRKRDEQVSELKRQVDRIEAAITLHQIEHVRSKR